VQEGEQWQICRGERAHVVLRGATRLRAVV
jgi:hypothetical protein